MKNITLKNTMLILACMLIGFCNNTHAQKRDSELHVGENVPLFTLHDQDNKLFNVRDYIGKKVLVLYFYPKDESMVCTKEACAFRDEFNDFTKAGAIVIGINGGTVASHKEFQQHYKLPFILLSDQDNKVYNLFGIKSKMFIPGRVTYVVDLHGKVVYMHEAMMQGKEHADDALQFIKAAKR
ncbi:MAG: peroxiredoxin [Sphingobacteriales bacterium]